MELCDVIEETLRADVAKIQSDDPCFGQNPYALINEMHAYYDGKSDVTEIQNLVRRYATSAYAVDPDWGRLYDSVVSGIKFSGYVNLPWRLISSNSLKEAGMRVAWAAGTLGLLYLGARAFLKPEIPPAIDACNKSVGSDDAWYQALDKHRGAYTSIAATVGREIPLASHA